MSKPSSKTTLSRSQIKKKLLSVAMALAKFEGEQRSYERVFVVFTAMHDMGPELIAKPHFLGEDKSLVGVVLDRMMLRDLFGPSLFARTEFFAHLASLGAAAASIVGKQK